jgi:hypothetical protein
VLDGGSGVVRVVDEVEHTAAGGGSRGETPRGIPLPLFWASPFKVTVASPKDNRRSQKDNPLLHLSTASSITLPRNIIQVASSTHTPSLQTRTCSSYSNRRFTQSTIHHERPNQGAQSTSVLYPRILISEQELAEIPSAFLKEGSQFMNRCTKRTFGANSKFARADICF